MTKFQQLMASLAFNYQEQQVLRQRLYTLIEEAEHKSLS